MRLHAFRTGLGVSALVVAAGLAACSSYLPVRTAHVEEPLGHAHRAQIEHPDRLVRVDGVMDEWEYGTVALADDDYIYLRFSIADRTTTLQSSDETLVLLLDLDGSALTGSVGEAHEGIAEMGIDLEIRFSPRNPGPGRGVALYLVDREGKRQRITHAAADFHFAPTYASDWYELRIARHVEGFVPWRRGESSLAVIVEGGGASEVDSVPAGPARAGGAFLLYDSRGERIGSAPPFEVVLAPPTPSRSVAELDVPSRRADAIRVVSYNVLHNRIEKTPEPFARVIATLEPDVVLFQEWDRTPPEEIAQWFRTHTGGTWTVTSVPRAGVAIATPHEMLRFIDEPPMIDGRPVRSVAALIRTPLMDTAIAGIHLKCCGSDGSSEDVRRIAEAEAVNAMLADVLPAWPVVRVIGGDVNLVGSRTPLEVLAMGLDSDDSDLTPADPIVLGDRAMFTWWEADNIFSPGRLDWVLYGDADAEVVAAFVLDTTRLTDEALARAGLERTDSLASDHFPLVVDLRPIR